MTGRERIRNILNRRPVDRLSWTTLVDRTSLSAMPEPEKAMTSLDFYRRIGCDVLQFGDYGLSKNLRVGSPAKAVWPECSEEKTQLPDGTVAVTTRTPWGALTSASRTGHPVKYPVESVADLRICNELWRSMRYEEAAGAEENFCRAEAAIGDQGMYIPTTDPSPVQELIEVRMGVANFYYLLQDHRKEVEALLEVMHSRRLQELEIILRRTAAEAIIPVENTSSTLTSPAVYERYSLPQIRDYADLAHRYGKKIVLHMCGLLKNLLRLIQRTGLDGYNAMTPPPVGDTALEYALDALGDDTVILGGVFDGAVFQKRGATKEQIQRALDDLYTPRVRRAHLVLALVADGLPTPLERFLAVRDWMEKKAAL